MGDRVAQVVLHGGRIASLADFFREVGAAVNGAGGYFGANLDAFSDCLVGGFGIDPPFTIIWMDSELAAAGLGHPETARHLEQMLLTCHPANTPRVHERLAAARQGLGPTLLDEIVEIIEGADGVTLELR